VIEPVNVVAFVPLVLRDAFRYRVSFGATLRALFSNSFATGVLDGRVLYSGVAPPPAEVVGMVASRLDVGGGGDACSA
jgi:hypothetical protein